MSDLKYIPIIGDKQAELHALASLPAQCRTLMLPLVDLRNPRRPDNARPTWTPESILTKRLTDPADGILGCWGSDEEVMIDGRQLDPRVFDLRTHPLDYAMQRCADAGLRVVVVTSRQRSAEYRQAAARWVRHFGGRAAIRLRDQDLFAGNDGAAVLLRELDLPKSSVDLVLDLQHVDANSTFMTSSTALGCIERLAPLTSWHSVSLVAGSFPAELSKVMGYNDLAVFPRAERMVWLQVDAGRSGSDQVRFGDYGILMAGDQDETPYPGSANLRYTDTTTWLVKRGFSRKKAASDDYARLSAELVELDVWRGANHCEGCGFLAERARAGRGGNPTQYRRAGFIHHFTSVAEELSPAA
ncbi:MAG: hypothetical protein R8G01_12295 [Ilumatobacteraceae bacterium]|nr:hypothetical protein [Ilumatobacteraceae bacterium]